MNNSIITKTVAILNQGGLIIFPTDTAYGLGCRLDNPQALQKINKITKRLSTMPSPVLVSSLKMAQKFLQKTSPAFIKLTQKFWPGPLTLIYKCQIHKVHPLVRGQGSTLGVRQPNHPIVLKIIQKIGVPILGTSANLHGHSTPFEKKDLNPKILKHVDLILGGNCPLKESSTVLDLSQTPWQVLRRGSIKVVLVTGCFDILHSEHQKFLQKSKEQGHILIVGVEPNSRVQKLKGSKRPINKDQIRIKNLKKLELADHIFILPQDFGQEKKRLSLLKKINPDILAISSKDPFLKIKKNLCQKTNICLKIVLPYNPKVSTTKILSPLTK
jgi:L-threonylcarbamoyladenylate synthase